MGAKPPQLDGDGIALAVSQLSREPFQEVLAHLIEGHPDREAVHKFANRHPDRWVNALRLFAQLSGS